MWGKKSSRAKHLRRFQSFWPNWPTSRVWTSSASANLSTRTTPASRASGTRSPTGRHPSSPSGRRARTKRQTDWVGTVSVHLWAPSAQAWWCCSCSLCIWWMFPAGGAVTLCVSVDGNRETWAEQKTALNRLHMNPLEYCQLMWLDNYNFKKADNCFLKLFEDSCWRADGSLYGIKYIITAKNLLLVFWLWCLKSLCRCALVFICVTPGNRLHLFYFFSV